MVIVPDSDIILIKSPLRLDNENQLTFNNVHDQYAYFMSLPHLEYDGCTYQRKDGVIRYNTNKESNPYAPRYEDLLLYNYCIYRNDSYKDKWFYAYITDINYVNDGMTTLKIETDVFQTWQFDIVYKQSFIEREHVSNDTIGAHTLPENLETGEYVINDANYVTNKLRNASCYVCMGVSYVPENTLWQTTDRTHGGIYSGLTLLIFNNETSASKFIRAYDKMGRGDAIVLCYMLPSTLAPNPNWQTASYDKITDIVFAVLPNTIGPTTIESNINIGINSTLNGYSPRNNKMFTFPYNYLSISNNCGTQVDFHYEDFVSNSPSFKILGLETANIPTILIPKNYKKYGGVGNNDQFYNYGITGGKFPNCSWQTDSYTNWLTQNGVNILGQKIDAPTSQALMGTFGALTSAGASDYQGIGSGLGTMFNAIQEQYRHSLQSPSVNGQTSVGDLSFSDDRLCFSYYKMSIKEEYARIIDDYFTLYGYKVNDVKTPNIHKRSNWDYIKTIKVNLEGDIPENDMEKIRTLFDNGCTFWHTTTYFLDYTRTNSIL